MDPEKKILNEDKKHGSRFVFTLEPSYLPLGDTYEAKVIIDGRLMRAFREGKKKYLVLIVSQLLERIEKADPGPAALGDHDERRI